MINDDFAHYLLNVPQVAEIVGTQIYPQQAPQSAALPYITFFDVFDAPNNHSTGASGYVEKRLQVDCWGTTYRSAKSLAREVRIALNAFQGTWRMTTVLHCLQISEIDTDTPPDSGQATGDRRVIMEFSIAYREPGV